MPTRSTRRLAGIVQTGLTLLIGTVAARAADAPARPFPHPPAWVADQTLYEVNLRQFSPEGTVAGFRKQLPRLRDLGVGTVWFMPVHPIGVDHRNGKLGSPYAPADYTAFNPEFGTLDDFKAAVDEAHRMGLHVLLDWVAVHTAPDHPWTRDHSDWYKHDAKGQLAHADPTWLDAVALNYDAKPLRAAMIDAMSFWVRDVGVDGFRCDSAERVPLDFWVEARTALRQIKPVFLLAEGNDPALLKDAFDAAYAWYLPENMEGLAKGTKTVADLSNFYRAEAKLLPPDRFRLNYTSNHDKNAWEGTTRDLLGGGADAFAVLTFTTPGMPLIFDGQECGVERRLNFFDRDPIVWADAPPVAGLYRTLATLKKENRALWAGPGAAPLQLAPPGPNPAVLTYRREAAGDRVVVTLNLSGKPAQVSAPDGVTKMRLVLGGPDGGPGGTLKLAPWGYRVWSSVQ